MPSSGISDSVIEVIGGTPMVRLGRIGRGLRCELLAKCEFLNPGGSLKDRIGARMVLDAERSGRIKPGDVLIEPSSGNTGIGIALAAAVRGYKVVIVMPEKMSHEKQVVLEALGAQIVRTRTEAGHDDPDSLFAVAQRLLETTPRAFMLDQYNNRANPDVHYETTAVEILEQTGGRFDYFVCGVGTGGAITGCARRFREAGVSARIVGVDPVGSILGGGEPGPPYLVEGIGYDFFPAVLDNSMVEEYIKTDDAQAFEYARRLIREEGLLVGGSSGSTLFAALQVAERCEAGERIVMVLPDSVRNYLSKFLSSEWLAQRGLGAPQRAQYVEWPDLERAP